jgi:hypothetical protein
MQTRSYPDMMVLTRRGGDTLESPHEKPIILPREGDMDPAKHAWADAFFATQILSEHGLFLSLMMPEEMAAEARSEAKRFHQELNSLHEEIANASPPQRSELQSLTIRPAWERRSGPASCVASSGPLCSTICAMKPSGTSIAWRP